MLGAAFRAQVALRAPGVVMIPAPVTEADDEPSDLPDAPVPGTNETPDAQTSGIRDVAAVTLDKARDHLLRLQDPRGWWIGELETNVTMDAEDVLLRHFLGILTDVELAETAGWIRSQQREDGTWANFYDGPGDLSTTVEAYVALKLAGDPVEAPHMKRAADLIVAAGGKAWAEKEADDRLAAAAASLDGIGVPADVRAEFIAIAEFITARQW